MRIRQVKPAFWTDRAMASLSYPARLFYIGLWCVADDAGYLEWDIDELGALLFPYEQPRRREKHMAEWSTELVESGRIRLLDCGCGLIPNLSIHQKSSGGKPSYTNREKHAKHISGVVRSDTESSGRKGTVGNGRERNGTVAPARDDQDHDDEASEFRRLVRPDFIGKVPA